MTLLKVQLNGARRTFKAEATPDLAEAIRASVAANSESDLVDRAMKAGDYAPGFRLPDRQTKAFDLNDHLARGPVVVSFYGGDWCPFCALELEALSEAHAEISALGASLVAVSPHPATRPAEPSPTDLLPFPLLIDAGAKTARKYGVAFRLSEPLRLLYAAMDLPPAADGLLPVPATYVIDQSGRIALSYIDQDFTTRLEPADIVVALRRLRERPHKSRSRTPEEQ